MKLTVPISDDAIRQLKVGDPVTLDGVMMTGRDAVHKWLYDTYVTKTRQPQGDDEEVYAAIKPLLDGGLIYHCGPVVAGLESKEYEFVAAVLTFPGHTGPGFFYDIFTILVHFVFISACASSPITPPYKQFISRFRFLMVL